MSIPFRTGYCINCGEQAYAKTFRGSLLAALPGTKLFYIVLSNDSGVECRVGTLMCCSKCDPLTFDIEKLKQTLFEQPHISGVSGNEPEWKMPNARIEIVNEYKPEVNNV